MEIELGWGVHDLPDHDHLSPDGSEERRYLSKLLEKADDCGVPISFNIVGHLLLEECDGSHAGPYDDGWFDADPGTDVATDPLFYAPDMAREISAAEVDHELCTHTFSHVLCGTEPRELVEHELETSIALHERLGEPVRSLVPPRHSRPPNDLLRDHGIRVARYAIPTDDGGRVSRFRELTVGPHPLWDTAVVDGVVETYCTTYPSLTASSLPSGQTPAPRLFRAFPLEVRKRVHQYYLRRSTERAIATGGSLHLWCHLYDLSNEHQWAVVSEYLEYLGSLPSDTLEIRPMNALAEPAETAARVP
ncbi:polysaccharide deacetylase [Halobaculum rarum]|uniref:polysaccharide deacetylase n=1 Tax=Halobaculum rarum TaxID=3075122 RepID=UPI0032AF49EA